MNKLGKDFVFIACFLSQSLLLLLRNDPAFGVYKYPIAVAVFAGGDVIVVALLDGADNLAAGQAEEGDDGGHVLEECGVFGGL